MQPVFEPVSNAIMAIEERTEAGDVFEQEVRVDVTDLRAPRLIAPDLTAL